MSSELKVKKVKKVKQEKLSEQTEVQPSEVNPSAVMDIINDIYEAREIIAERRAEMKEITKSLKKLEAKLFEKMK